MGWKASTIIISKPTTFNVETLLKELGFENLTRIEEKPFEAVINPDDNKVYVGSYKDNILVCVQDIPIQIIEGNKSQAELALNRISLNSEVCSIALHSAVNLWGYSVIKNGQKIRARAGNADDGTYIEFGEPLEEEKELLSKSTMDADGKQTYIFQDFPDDPMTEDQVGENFVFAICKRYFGEELDKADDLLFETKLQGFSFQSSPEKKSLPEDKKKSKWMTYGIILLLIVLWQIFKRTIFKD